MLVQPFPQNPSFKPPVPVSNALKNAIFDQFMADPQANSVRALASKYHLSIKRVEAILRLKGLEQHWVKVCSRFLRFVPGASPFRSGFSMMSQKSISLEDISPWLNNQMHGFLTLYVLLRTFSYSMLTTSTQVHILRLSVMACNLPRRCLVSSFF